jgi:hypothetical protein
MERSGIQGQAAFPDFPAFHLGYIVEAHSIKEK